MKKITAVLICLLLVAGALYGCSSKPQNNENTKTDSNNSKSLSIVTTIFPEYDWVRQITGDDSDAEITLLLDNGVDLHNFQPTADDIIKISECDMFIYVGGESDEWVEDVLKEAASENMTVFNLLEALGDSVKEEEIIEGMQGEEEEGKEEGEEEGPEYDEHVWLSLKNAQVLVTKIAEELGRIDTERKETYLANAESYNALLKALDAQYQSAVDAAETKTLLFGDRFPFRYMVEDYGLDYYAAFVGCSAETEASFETIVFLAHKADELGLKSIMQIETADGKIAATINENTKAKDLKILTMDSLQSTTSSGILSGATYLSAMENNLTVLKEALG